MGSSIPSVSRWLDQPKALGSNLTGDVEHDVTEPAGVGVVIAYHPRPQAGFAGDDVQLSTVQQRPVAGWPCFGATYATLTYRHPCRRSRGIAMSSLRWSTAVLRG
jgi:hypothetical protein